MYLTGKYRLGLAVDRHHRAFAFHDDLRFANKEISGRLRRK